MKEFLVYTALRLSLFVTTCVVVVGLYVVVFGRDGVLLAFLAAIIVSSLLSLKLLAPQRDRLARVVQGRAERAAQKFDDLKSREDVD